jgi:hypothetical protein
VDLEEILQQMSYRKRFDAVTIEEDYSPGKDKGNKKLWTQVDDRNSILFY